MRRASHPFLPMKITRLLALLAALATGTLAQTTSTDPAKLVLAREVIAVMKADKMFDAMAAQMKQSAMQITAVPANATPEQRAKATALQGKIFDLSMAAAKGMIAKMDQIYADVYTEAELHAMKTFFSSPEGQSMLAKQPQIMQHVMPLVQEMQRTLIPQVQKLVEDAKTAEVSLPAPAPAGK